MRNTLAIIFALFSFVSVVSAIDFPFVDVPLWNPNHAAIRTLYEHSIIHDDGSHKFKPDDTLTRDAFVGILMGSSCSSCLHPSIEEITKFQTSPFPDISKENPYYYCIARAYDEKIIDGITLDQWGKAVCENNESFSATAFCKNNSITRLMAAIALLKQANLWNEEQNSKFDKTVSFIDIPENLAGYAQKAIQIGILSKDQEGKIRPNDTITRSEFAKMASRVFEYNQCALPSSGHKIGSSILLVGTDGESLDQSLLSKNTPFQLEWLTEDNENYTFTWNALLAESGAVVSVKAPILTSDKLGVGTWFISLSVSEKDTGEIVSKSTLTITISAVTPQNLENVSEPPSISLIAAPNAPLAWWNVTLTTQSNGKEPLRYIWNFWDGTRSKSITDSSKNEKNGGIATHSYTSPWVYTLSVIMTDADEKSAIASVVIKVAGTSDVDGDGVEDSLDACPYIKGDSESKGCPSFKTNIYTKWVFLSSNQDITSSAQGFWLPSSSISASTTSPSLSSTLASSTLPSSTTSSSSAASSTTVSTTSTALPSSTASTSASTTSASSAASTTSSTAASSQTASDSDNDGIDDSLDACPNTPGNIANGWCPLVGSFLGNIEQNACIMAQIQQTGGIIIEPICESCPCANTISLWNSLRRCDVIFPAILSKDLQTIYSRWPLFQIP